MTCNGDLRGIGGFRDVVMVNLLGYGGFQVTVMGFEPATYTSEALVDQYLHGS